MTIIIAIINLIEFILCVILFFKIWGMTNNVNEIKDRLTKDDDFKTRGELREQLRKSYVLGDKERIKRILILLFIERINYKCNIYQEEDMRADNPNLNISIIPYVENLSKTLAIIGEKTPECILNMKTYKDYYNLYKKSDFKIDNI